MIEIEKLIMKIEKLIMKIEKLIIEIEKLIIEIEKLTTTEIDPDSHGPLRFLNFRAAMLRNIFKLPRSGAPLRF